MKQQWKFLSAFDTKKHLVSNSLMPPQQTRSEDIFLLASSSHPPSPTPPKEKKEIENNIDEERNSPWIINEINLLDRSVFTLLLPSPLLPPSVPVSKPGNCVFCRFDSIFLRSSLGLPLHPSRGVNAFRARLSLKALSCRSPPFTVNGCHNSHTVSKLNGNSQ